MGWLTVDRSGSNIGPYFRFSHGASNGMLAGCRQMATLLFVAVYTGEVNPVDYIIGIAICVTDCIVYACFCFLW